MYLKMMRATAEDTGRTVSKCSGKRSATLAQCAARAPRQKKSVAPVEM